MKNTFYFCCIVFFNSVLAQDTIHKLNNDIVIAKISEINSSEIKYKRYAFQDGPTYLESKSNVRMIVYANGVKEIIKAVPGQGSEDYVNVAPRRQKIEIDGRDYILNGAMCSEKKIQRLLLDTKDPQITGFVAKAKQAQKLQYIGFGAIPLGIAGLLLMENSVSTNYSTNGQYSTTTRGGMAALSGICIAGAISCPIISGVFKHKRKRYNMEAVNLYNERY